MVVFLHKRKWPGVNLATWLYTFPIIHAMLAMYPEERSMDDFAFGLLLVVFVSAVAYYEKVIWRLLNDDDNENERWPPDYW